MLLRKLSFAALFFSALVLRADSQGIETVALRCAKAAVSGDYHTVMACTHHRLIESAGGRDAFIKVLDDAMSQLRSKGITLIDAKPGKPGEEIQIGVWRVALLPQTIVLKVDDGRIVSESCLLAISEDKGRTWTLIDLGNLPEESRFDLYPEFKGKITFPEKKAPVFIKDKNG